MFKEKELKTYSSSPVIDFLIEVFSKKNYRGIHMIQHSRTTSDEYQNYLKEIFNIVGTKMMEIPKGDEFHPIKKPKGFHVAKYPEFEKLLNAISKLNYSSKSSPQSLKKITFVDLSRFGLIDRFTTSVKNGISLIDINSNKRPSNITHIKINSNGIKFSKIINKVELNSSLGEIINKSHSSLVDIIYKSISEFEYISEVEFMFFVSKVDDIDYDQKNIFDMINFFRKLSRNQKEAIENFFRKNSTPKKAKVDEEYWDFHNLKNQTQTIFKLLSKSYLFNYTEGKITFENAKDKKPFKRQRKIINEYDEFYSIKKYQKPSESGFEYHHIVPFSWAKTFEESLIIDNILNLLLISGTKHNQLPKKYNELVNVKRENNNLILYGGPDKYLSLEIGVDVFIDEKKIDKLIEYNININEKLK